MTTVLQNTSTSEDLAHNNEYVESDLFREIFFFASALMTLIGNAVVLVTLLKSRNLQKIQHWLIANLAIGDMSSGIVVLIFNSPTAQLHRWVFGDFLCTFSGFLLQMFAFQTIITLACISLDRYYAICYALHYRTKMTKTKFRLMVLVSWLYPILTCSPPFYGWGHYRFSPPVISCMMVWGPDVEDLVFSSFQGVTCYITSGVIIFCYIKIWKQSRKTFITNPLTTPQHEILQQTTLTNLVKKELKVAKMIIVMIAAFVVTWFPFIIFKALQKHLPTHVLERRTTIIAERVILLLFTCSTFVNPIIYSLLDQRFRREVTRVCSRRS